MGSWPEAGAALPLPFARKRAATAQARSYSASAVVGGPLGPIDRAARSIARKRAPTSRSDCPCLPPIYPITPDGPVNAQWWRLFEAGLARGYTLLQLRVRNEPRPVLHSVVERAARLCREASCELMLNGPLQWVEEFDLAGIHLPAAALMALARLPLGREYRVAASCHNPDELRRAEFIGADWACLSPVRHTPSHPDSATLGLETFGAWARQSKIPVFALGGLGPGDVPAIQAAGGQGVAGISAFWG